MSSIVVIGSLNMDLVIQSPRMPSSGETIAGGDFQMIPGGKGANQAAAAARLGGSVTMVGRVGDDAFGPNLTENLARQGVDTSKVRVDSETSTGVAIIIVDDTGENSIVISAGANGQVSQEDVNAAKDLINGAEYLLLQHEIPFETVQHAIDVASLSGTRVILNPAPVRPIPADTLAKIDILVPNEIEARFLSDVQVDDLASAQEAGERILQQGPTTVVITLGAKGALAVTKEDAVHVPAREVEAVDTTAAGDAFIGGLAVALSEGHSLDEAVRYASGAGTLAVTKFGAQTSLPTAEEVDAFLKPA